MTRVTDTTHCDRRTADRLAFLRESLRRNAPGIVLGEKKELKR